jgi:DNA repair protein RecO (recombination protein O)
MSRVEGQPAFIVHGRAYRETSLLLECLTPDHGRVGLIARGVRRERTRMPRGLLQPLQPLRLDGIVRGELGTLTGAEAAGASAPVRGESLLAAMYLNELVLRLIGRGDPQAVVFDTYATCLERLGSGQTVGWTLRRFERDLLAHAGYALVLDARSDDGSAIEAEADYVYDPEAGPSPWRGQPGALRVSGASLLALAEDRVPSPEGLEQLRRLMRIVIRHHLGGGTLNAWSMSLTGITPAAG